MAGTYRSEYTGAQIDASVAFGHNPDSTPTANSVAGVTSGGVKAALDAETNARQAADTTLQNNINAEAAAREQADNALGTEIGHKQDILTFDDTPRQNSSNPVKSSGIWQKNRELYSAMQGGDADILAEMRENYARVDGAYENFTSGNTEQLLATQYVEDSVPYIFRPSGNHADIGDREFDTLVGGSIVWNQLMPTFSAATTGTSQQQFVQVAGQNDVFTVGRKYFVRVDVASLSDYADCRMRYPSVRYLFAERNQFIVDATNANFAIELESSDGSDVQLALPANYAMACDLTLMLGSAVADYIYNLEAANTGAGVAYLLNLIPLLGGDYLPQNSGTMLSVNASAHETVGFNQWDEELEVGTIDATTGANVASSSRGRSKNYIPVLPSTTYYAKIANLGGNHIGLYYYDANKSYIGTETAGVSDNLFTTPNNCAFLRFSPSITYGTSYKNDICINLSWNATRNGEYEPYEKRTYPLDNTRTLRGVLVVENSNVKYDGDIYNPDGTVERRYGVVDLGTLDYNANTNYGYQSAGALPNIKPVADNNGVAKACCSQRINASFNILYAAGTSGTYIAVLSSGKIAINSDIATAAAFKAAMSNVMFVYELATPTTESATPYQSPQIVDDWGTERYVDYEYSIGQRPIPVPVGHETKYPANLRDKVQHLPSLADANGTYAIQQTGTQMSLTSLSLFGLLSSGAPELHRMIYRGKNLGTSFTAAQKAAIVNGSFDDLWLGDYWVIGGVTYVIADFDYWYQCGDTAFTKHHIVVIPSANMYNAKMNDSNVTTGGYYGSKMRGVEVEGTFTPYAEGCGLYNALTAFQAAFGDALLTRREYLCNAVEDGKESAGAWFDSIVDLPSEIMMYGNSIRAASPRIATIGKSQLALMAASPKFIDIRATQWLRDVVSATRFAIVYATGVATDNDASNSRGVRPVAAIGG